MVCAMWRAWPGRWVASRSMPPCSQWWLSRVGAGRAWTRCGISARGMSERRVESDLDKGYEPASVEARWARWWEEQGFYRSQDVSNKPPFSMVLPPPNVTGSLHLGHALTAAIEDALARYKRMSGFNVCWMPGIDHAGIATQMVVERQLQKSEGKSRHDLGREEFLRRVWRWKEQSGNRIALQHRALGASLDWDRERFTMDEQSSRAVREAFVRLYEEKLLYRAERLINWCVSDRTALSDLEVDHEENVKSELYKFAYPLADGSGEIVVATTRPETMLGDTAVAVHPDDERYKAMIGKSVRHPITGREFPIIADAELVDPKFGTGAVKVTPAHSFEDFESGKRHHLQFINILNPDGTLNANAGPFRGQDRIEARGPLKAKLEELGLGRGSEPHTMPLRPLDAGSGRARHLVLVGALAVLDVRMARRYSGAEDLLPELRDGDGLRHPLLLGRPDGDARSAFHGPGALPHRPAARDGAGREGREDVEDARQRHRPPRRHHEVRRGCSALHPRVDGGAGTRHQAVHRAHRRLPGVRQQDLERGPVRPHERGRIRSPCPAGLGLRPLDPQPFPALCRRDARFVRALRAERGGERDLPVHLERAVRLSHGAEQAGPLRREDARGARLGTDRAPHRPRRRAALAASVHAVRDGGDLATAAEPDGADHHAGALSRVWTARRRGGAGDGRHLPGHRRRPLRARRGEPAAQPAHPPGPFRQGSRALRAASASVPAPRQRQPGDPQELRGSAPEASRRARRAGGRGAPPPGRADRLPSGEGPRRKGDRADRRGVAGIAQAARQSGIRRARPERGGGEGPRPGR